MGVSERRKLILVTLFIVAANALDLFSTYLVCPGLEQEWNVLERWFGLGWAGLLVAKLIGGAFAVFGYAYYLRYRIACYPAETFDAPAPRAFSTFCQHFAFGKNVSWLSQHWRRRNSRHLLVGTGYFWTGMQWMVVWVALDNLLLQYGFAWEIRRYSETAYHVLQSTSVASLVLMRYYWGNYQRYLRLIRYAPTNAPVFAAVRSEAATPRTPTAV